MISLKARLDDLLVSAAQEMGWREPTRARSAVSIWRNFVSECKAGYTLGLFEYDHDLKVRDLLEGVIQNPNGLEGSEEFRGLVAEVRLVDEEFRDVLNLGLEVKPDDRWWHRYLPVSGGEYLVEDVLELYGVRIAESAT